MTLLQTLIRVTYSLLPESRHCNVVIRTQEPVDEETWSQIIPGQRRVG
jgi:hypothetical protein